MLSHALDAGSKAAATSTSTFKADVLQGVLLLMAPRKYLWSKRAAINRDIRPLEGLQLGPTAKAAEHLS